MENHMPTLHDIIAAQKHVYRFLKPTPLYHYPSLSELLGANVWVKHENHQPVGAFKVRGGLNLAAHLTPEECQAGLFTASTGNTSYEIQIHLSTTETQSTQRRNFLRKTQKSLITAVN